MTAKKNKSARVSTRRKSSKLAVEERALHAVMDGLRTLRDAAGESSETRHAEELALNAVMALAERAGLGPFFAPTSERVEQAYNVLFGGRTSDADGIHIRDIADVLWSAVAGKGTRTETINVSVEASRSARAHGGVDKLLAFGNSRITATLARHGTKVTLATARCTLAFIDPALANAKLLPLLQHLAKGGSLSGVITDLLRETGALSTHPTHNRQDVQKRVTQALKRKP